MAGGWKLIKTTHRSFWETPDIELFNLGLDPLEKKNIADEEPETVDRLELQMTKWLDIELRGRADPVHGRLGEQSILFARNGMLSFWTHNFRIFS